MTTVSQSQYEANELRRLHTQLEANEKASLQDRKEASQDYYEILSLHPDWLNDSVHNILLGNYGEGATLKAFQILGMNANANKIAALSLLVAGLDKNCSRDGAVKAFKRLTGEQAQKANHAVRDAVIAACEYFLSEWGEEFCTSHNIAKILKEFQSK